MERENRYIVIKRKDVEQGLMPNGQRLLDSLLKSIEQHRIEQGNNPDKRYVVVSEDWPMYEQTWKAIEEWVDGSASSPMPLLSVTDTHLVDDAIGSLARYGYNCDRKSLSAILAVVLDENREMKRRLDVVLQTADITVMPHWMQRSVAQSDS